MTKDEALKLALEALERSVATCFDRYSHDQVMSKPYHFINQTITAIKEALAQPEQEPVAWLESDPSTKNWPLRDLFTGSWNNAYSSHWHVGSKKPDAPLGNRLTPLYTTPPQSFTYEQVKAHIQAALLSSSMPQLQTFTGENPFPPQRQWVGLTEEEKESFWRADQMTHKEWEELFAAIEAKLREKNT